MVPRRSSPRPSQRTCPGRCTDFTRRASNDCDCTQTRHELYLLQLCCFHCLLHMWTWYLWFEMLPARHGLCSCGLVSQSSAAGTGTHMHGCGCMCRSYKSMTHCTATAIASLDQDHDCQSLKRRGASDHMISLHCHAFVVHCTLSRLGTQRQLFPLLLSSMQAPGDVTRSFRRSFRNSVPLNLDQLSKRNPCSGKITHVHPNRINKSTLTTNLKLQLTSVKELYRTFRDHVIFELKIHEKMAAVGNISSFTCSKFSGKQQNKQIMIRKACTKLGACQQPLWISQDPCDDCLFPYQDRRPF